MRAHRFAHLELFLAQLPREPCPLGKEFHLLYHPSRAMRVLLLLAHDAPLGVPLSRSDRHRAARHPAGADEIPNLGLRFPGDECALEILTPEGPLALARRQLQVIREVLSSAELVVRAPVFGQAANDELTAA